MRFLTFPIAVVAAIALAGCAAPVVEKVAEPRPTATKHVFPVVAKPATITGGRVATGTFESSVPGVGGSIAVDYVEDRFRVELEEITMGSLDQPFIGFADDDLKVGDCLGEGAQAIVTWGQVPAGHEQSLDGFEGDPSFFSTAVIVEYMDMTASCNRRIIAAAPLTWTVPDLWPDIEARDSGEASGAYGEVLDGESYVTVANDSLDAIATRFGITVDQLNWLNPCRPIAYDRAKAYEGEVLNLAKDARGARLPSD